MISRHLGNGTYSYGAGDGSILEQKSLCRGLCYSVGKLIAQKSADTDHFDHFASVSPKDSQIGFRK